MSEKFIVTFYDDDNITVLDKQEVSKGAKVEYQGKIPEKADENGIKYYFVGWNTEGNINNVQENVDLYAKYETANKINEQENKMYGLSEQNAENSQFNNVVDAGKKLEKIENLTRDMSSQEKNDLINQIKEKGSIEFADDFQKEERE